MQTLGMLEMESVGRPREGGGSVMLARVDAAISVSPVCFIYVQVSL